MSFVRFLAWFALGGALVPLIFQVIWWLLHRYQMTNVDLKLGVQNLTLVLWPSSLIMSGVHGDESVLPVL